MYADVAYNVRGRAYISLTCAYLCTQKRVRMWANATCNVGGSAALWSLFSLFTPPLAVPPSESGLLE